MKDFDPILQTAGKTKFVNQRQVESRKELFAQQKLYNGHTMWQIDCLTGEISEAQYSNERIEIVPQYDINFGVQTGITKRVVRDIISKENCVYIGALNKKSAKRKYYNYLLTRSIEKLKNESVPNPTNRHLRGDV
jgi:hypothetical protein